MPFFLLWLFALEITRFTFHKGKTAYYKCTWVSSNQGNEQYKNLENISVEWTLFFRTNSSPNCLLIIQNLPMLFIINSLIAVTKISRWLLSLLSSIKKIRVLNSLFMFYITDIITIYWINIFTKALLRVFISFIFSIWISIFLLFIFISLFLFFFLHFQRYVINFRIIFYKNIINNIIPLFIYFKIFIY
jgi:hypothetical protein